MSFGQDLMDQWDNVEKYGEHGVAFFDSLQTFLKKQSEIENEYAKNTQKLVKSFKDELSKKSSNPLQKVVAASTVSQCWLQILNEIENLAESHGSFSEGIENEIRKPIYQQMKDNKKSNKECFDEVRNLLGNLKKQIEKMEKAREKFNHSEKDMNSAREALEKLQKSVTVKKEVIEKHEKELEKKATMALEDRESYQNIIAETNVHKDVFYSQSLPKSLDKFQIDDEKNRIEFIKTILSKYQTQVQNRILPLTKASESLSTVFSAISSSYDSSMFINMTKQTNKELPADFIFEEKVDVKRHRATSASPSMSSVKSKDAQLTDQEILDLPLKQGKKKATERIKQLEKDIIENTKKIQSVKTLISVKHSADLEGQLDYLDSKSDYLTLKKYHFECYTVPEGKPAPPIPSVLEGKNLSDIAAWSSDEITRKRTSFSPLKSGSSSPSQSTNDLDEKKRGDMVRALYDFQGGEGSEELSFVEGDEFEVLENSGDGWILVKDSNGKNGIVPENYVLSRKREN